MNHDVRVTGDGYGYVYIMSYPNSNKVKIGHSLNPGTRTKQIGGTLAPETPILEATYWCSERRETVERTTHEQLKNFRGNGEWFNVSIPTAMAAIEVAATSCGVEVFLTSGVQPSLSLDPLPATQLTTTDHEDFRLELKRIKDQRIRYQ